MPSKNRAHRERLPFASKRPGLDGLWNVRPTGDYEADYKTGAEYAVTLWTVCSERSNCGFELSSIFGDTREKAQLRHCGRLIRTIGEIVDATTPSPVVVAPGGLGQTRDAGRLAAL